MMNEQLYMLRGARFERVTTFSLCAGRLLGASYLVRHSLKESLANYAMPHGWRQGTWHSFKAVCRSKITWPFMST